MHSTYTQSTQQGGNKHNKRTSYSTLSMVLKDSAPPDVTVIEDDDDDDDKGIKITKVEVLKSGGSAPDEEVQSSTKKRRESTRSKAKDPVDEDWKTRSKSNCKKNPRMVGTSWLQKNAAFVNESFDEEDDEEPPQRKTFREDFQGTRVFVQGLPSEASWQDLKDHFALAGNVVFASVSVDPVTGQSKSVGLVQFETNEMAQNAIRIMRNHPLNGSVLYVREDFQEKRSDGARLRNQIPNANNRNRPPQKWECADDENSSVLSAEERESVISLISARDAARRRKNYDASDQMRQELKSQFGVHLDDRLKQWWVSFDGSHVPRNVQAVKGEGRWGGKQAWRQIPTTPENDACVNPDLVNGLLMQRDIARKEKDFTTADALLEEARSSPDGELYLRIHDESRTWRIWTEEKPQWQASADRADLRKSAAEQCIELIREKAPHKEEEIKTLLRKFPGRNFQILKKLKKSLKDV